MSGFVCRATRVQVKHDLSRAGQEEKDLGKKNYKITENLGRNVMWNEGHNLGDGMWEFSLEMGGMLREGSSVGWRNSVVSQGRQDEINEEAARKGATTE